MSLMLCLINISHQEKSNALLENTITNKNLKNEIKIEAKTNTNISKNTEMKSKTEVKTQIKSENVAKAQSEAKGKSQISTMLELHATSKSVTEVETEGLRIIKGYVMIKGRGNLCIKTARNKRITQARCDGKNNVLWKFIVYKGRYIIQNKNGYVLDNYAFNKNNGGPIYAFKRNNKNNQKWTMRNLGRGKFELQGQHSGKCIDNTGKARNGVGYHQWSCSNRNKNQHFKIVSPKKRSKVHLPTTYVQIKGKGNLCIHANANKRVKQGPCNSSKNALWKFAKVGNAYVIQNKNEGRVLNVLGGKKNNGAYIKGSTRNNGRDQKFYYIKLRGGKFELKNVNSGKCLDNTGKSRRGVGYHQWSCNSGNKNQHFRIVNPKKVNKRNKRKIVKKNKNGKKISPKMRRLINKNKNKKSKKVKAPSGWGMIKGGGNLCIQTAKNKRIRQGPCNKRNNSLWKFIRMGNYYVIQNKNGNVLDNYAFKKKNGGPIFAWRRNNKNNQKWSYLVIGGGKFELKGLNSGKCLDNTGKARNRVGYHQWSCNSGNKNQHFRFVRTARAKRSLRKGKSSRKRGSRKGKSSKKRGSRKGKSSKKRGSRKGKSSKKRGSRKGKSSKKRSLRSRKGKSSKKRSLRSRKGKSSRKRGSRKGKSSKKRGSRKGKSSKKRGSRKAGKKASKKFNKKNAAKKSLIKSNKKNKTPKPKTGYKKRKNIRFMGGKYRFNLITGKEFCTKKCKPNKSAPMKKCFKGTVQNCNSCVFIGDKKDKDSDELCKNVCNAIDKEKTCEFYTFIDAKQKVVNKRLLNRFGRIFIKKYLKK